MSWTKAMCIALDHGHENYQYLHTYESHQNVNTAYTLTHTRMFLQHLAEAKVKATAVFGVSGGGIIDDD
jgi:hypothetical protein